MWESEGGENCLGGEERKLWEGGAKDCGVGRRENCGKEERKDCEVERRRIVRRRTGLWGGGEKDSGN